MFPKPLQEIRSLGRGSLNVDESKGHLESKASLNVQLGWSVNPIGTNAIETFQDVCWHKHSGMVQNLFFSMIPKFSYIQGLLSPNVWETLNPSLSNVA
jgi:hypothetical protein